MIIHECATYYEADEGYIFKKTIEPFDEKKNLVVYDSDTFYDFEFYEEIPILEEEDSRNE